ncbi:MAG: 3-deoxy-manno-octulosonate cytidylyltransferase [Myxococcota bacterium]|nr:3-deoxy-manno-octulosonate cytidylyltransferase [Myxococcota bacterium]
MLARNSIAAIIPARYASTRFPGKPLVPIGGKSMIQRVYEQVLQARLPDAVLIAVDDERVRSVCASFGARTAMTSPALPSGTDRCLAAAEAENLSSDIIVNVQGDEPLVNPRHVDLLASALRDRPAASIATIAVPFAPGEDSQRSDVVKLVCDRLGRMLYCSRASIPHDREGAGGVNRLRHVGLYAFRREALRRFVEAGPSPLEQAEGLEQLRALELGMEIVVVRVDHAAPSVDIPADVERIERLLSHEPEKTLR